MSYIIPTLPLQCELETKAILKQTIAANRKLAELKGIVNIIPNPSILIRTLSLQEAKDSSAIESIITTHDELYKAEVGIVNFSSAAAKEVSTYADALMNVVGIVKQRNIITENNIQEIYHVIKHNDGGYIASPSKVLVNEQTEEIIYTPPQSIDEIQRHMSNLALFINDDSLCELDPLIKMAIIHHQFESIHPFGDGNGRAGRVLNILYLVVKGLLDMPILYLSRYIIQHKGEYYRLLQAVRDEGVWEDWILFMLNGIEKTAEATINFVKDIAAMMMQYKHHIRESMPKIYSQDLINHLFRHPYTKIEYLVNDMNVSRPTATSYLDRLIEAGYLSKIKTGKGNLYINNRLYNLIINAFHANEGA